MAENLISKIKVGNTEYGLETTIANVNGLQTSLDNKISHTVQSLDNVQQSQARANINAQEKLVGVAGQVVGFDANGNAVAQEAPSGGDNATWAGLPDKPVVMASGDTLTWDGNTDGKTTVSFRINAFDNIIPMNACRVSETVVPVNAMSENNEMVVGSSDGTSSSGEEVLMFSMFNDDGFCAIGFYQVVVVPTDNYSASLIEGETTVFPTKGTYFAYTDLGYVSHFTIPGYTGFAQEKIAPSYLYQHDWNQNDSTQPDYVNNRTHYEIGRTMREIMPATEITPMDDGSGNYMAELDASMFTAKEKQIVVTLDGVEYVCDCFNEDEGIAFGNLAMLDGPIESSEPFVCMVMPMYEMCVMAFIDDLTHTVSMSEVNVEYKKLADGYINSEWLAQRAPSSYDICIDSSITFKSGESSISIPINVFPSHGGRITDLEVTWNGTYYKCPCQRFGLDFNNYAYFAGLSIMSGSLTGEYPFGIVIQKGSMAIYVPEENAGSTNIISVRAITSLVIKPLDSDFLPETLLHYEDQNLEESQKNTARYNIGAQAKLTGTEGQVVGFDKNGNAIAQEVPTDNTLSITGAAADANAVGAALEEIELGFGEGLRQLVGSSLLSIPGALQWNGIIGDRDYVTVSNNEGTLSAFVHISDEVPTILPETLCTIGVAMFEGGVMQISQTVEVSQIGDEAYAITSEYMLGFIIVPSSGFVIDGVTFPKAGIYGMAMSYLPSGIDISLSWASGLYIPGYEFASEGASKYFEKQTITTEIGDTLTWDGVIGDREYGHLEIEDIKVDVVCVSHSTPTAEELSAITSGSMTIIQDNNIITYDTISEVLEATDSNGKIHTRIKFSKSSSEDGSGTAYITYANNTLVDGVNLPSPGIYFTKANYGTISVCVSSMTLSGYQFIETKTAEVIKTEHLPEALRFGEIPSTALGSAIGNGDTITWDYDTTGLDIVEFNMENNSNEEPLIIPLARISSLTPSNIGNWSLFPNDADVPIEGNGYIYDARPEKPIAIFGGEEILILASLTVVTFEDNVSYNGNFFPHAGIYVISVGTEVADGRAINLTIEGVQFGKTLKTIDPKYLPEGYGGSGSAGGITEETDPTVPAWAKEPNKPTYTASEVGAAPEEHSHNSYITKISSSTNNSITRFNGTNGEVQNSKIIIEDTTNSRDQSKGQVIAIPTTGGKKMVYGLCTDQTDGTAFIGGLFNSSTTSYPYAEGLAIGGSTGNLLWKGIKVTTADDTYAASKITAGTFAGQVIANSSNQAASTSLLRNSKLVSTDTNPTVNGEICWTYE